MSVSGGGIKKAAGRSPPLFLYVTLVLSDQNFSETLPKMKRPA